MKPRAILVGEDEGRKLYYFLDPVGSGKNDGAVINDDNKPEMIDFFTYTATRPYIKEYKFTDFHKFLWDNPKKEDEKRWVRTFINKTQSVDGGLLNGVKIETDLDPGIRSKHYFENRGIDFKTLRASNALDVMDGSILSRQIPYNLRTVGSKIFKENKLTAKKKNIRLGGM
jgi:hypothetical protein